MKKIIFLGFLLAFCFFTFELFAQPANNEQRLVGTWVQEADEIYVPVRLDDGWTAPSGTIWVFNNDGRTGSISGRSINYGATISQFAIISNNSSAIYEYTLSTDGRTLILSYRHSGGSGRIDRVLLRKRN
jgi:hypothetical protein